MSHAQLTRWLKLALVYSVVVILFGAFVRASLSGDGCGVSWPLCGGSMLAEGHPMKRAIELTHRMTSGLLGVLLIGLYFALRGKKDPTGGLARKAVGWSVVSCIISGIIGALLVLNSWVVFDRSVARAITMPIHLVNNYFLVGALGIGMWYAKGMPRFGKLRGEHTGLLAAVGVSSLVLGLTGALSAMGKTAFAREVAAAQGLADRLHLHVGSEAHPLLKGGVAHPLLATSLTVLIVWACSLMAKRTDDPGVQRWSKRLSYGMLAQFGVGLLNLLISAPAWMQLIHLAVALGLWMAFVALSAHVLRPRADVVEDEVAQGDPAMKLGLAGAFKAYIALTKPRVISLLLVTTFAAQVMAAQGWPGGWLVLWLALGGYMMAGAANTINMMLERDLDVRMGRTASRPTVTHAISNLNAGIFAAVLIGVSFGLITWSSNVLSALLAFAGLLFYVFVYTLLLKRRTWQNIVIGGAAGAFPPLVGWASVTGDLSPLAWILFAVIFLWTPVHFWALAILIKDDYAKAGVPMLPVVRGEQVTSVQIVVYAVLTAVCSLLPLFDRNAGPGYLVIAALLNVGLLMQSLGLLKATTETTRPKAKALFKYSMVYLAVLFITLAVDRSFLN